MLTPDPANEITSKIIGCAIEVHRQLGPGLLEFVYEQCLLYEPHKINLAFKTQLGVAVHSKGVTLSCGFTLDVGVEDQVLVEVKAVEQLAWIHKAQLLTYLRLTGKRLGLVINFNVPVLKQGIRRLINTR